jgi:DNA-binding NtrC family response regulator
VIEVEDLPEAMRTTTAEFSSTRSAAIGFTEHLTLAEAERWLIERALARCDGNKREAARQLGLSLATLYRKLASYGDDGGRRDDDQGPGQ